MVRNLPRMPVSISDAYRDLVKIVDWNIGIVQHPVSDFLKPGFTPHISWLRVRPGSKYLADPFGLMRDGRLFILCEEFDYSKSRGKIVCYEVADGGNSFTRSDVVLNASMHMSYPYLLESEGQLYCIPETHQAREIALYRALEFPYKWEKVRALIEDFSGVDSTVFQFGGYWWLACVSQEYQPWESLFLWYADSLTGSWNSHKANPVKRDLGSSRPAGTPFTYDGSLYRPAQNCSSSYGEKVVINKITRLTPEDFREETIATVEPFSPYLDGIHTISAVNGISLLDGKRLRSIRSFAELRYNIRSQKRHLERRFHGRD